MPPAVSVAALARVTSTRLSSGRKRATAACARQRQLSPHTASAANGLPKQAALARLARSAAGRELRHSERAGGRHGPHGRQSRDRGKELTIAGWRCTGA